MSWPDSIASLGRARPPVSSVLALDAGSRRIKLLLVENRFGRLHLRKQELIDLRAEGLVSTDEIKTHLQARLEDWGKPPLGLVLPQHVCTSLLVDLPPASEAEVEKLVASEAIKLGGVSETHVIYDFIRSRLSSRDRQRFWVTLCQEGNIRDRIVQLGVEREDLCEVTTTANALVAAYAAAAPATPEAVLVHMGAQATAVAIVVGGEAAFATSFPMGAEFLNRALARIRNCPEKEAESLRCGSDLLAGPAASPEFASVVDGWATELKRQLNDWFNQNRAIAPDRTSVPLVASGGGFDQPGLLQYLKINAGLRFESWPVPSQAGAAAPDKGFEAAFGTALQALGRSSQPVSLLPQDYRQKWKKRLGRQQIEFASALLVLVCALLLAFGTWRHLSMISRKEALVSKVAAGQEAFDANAALSAELADEYQRLRPILARHQNTIDTLRTLALLQQSRSNRSYWYVLIADQQTYFNPPQALALTNRPARTNQPFTTLDRARFAEDAGPGLTATNTTAAKPGCIAELCIPEENETARRILGQLVLDLKKHSLFSKVDLLSDDLRRNIADPKLLLPDRDFVITLDFAQTEFQAPTTLKKPPGQSVRRASRPARSAATNIQSPAPAPPRE